MKIIAQTSFGYAPSFLVEMADQELARLLGFYSASTNQGCPDLKVGRELEIHKVYESIRNLGYETSNQTSNSLQARAKELRALADSLDALKVNLDTAGKLARTLPE